MLEVYEDRLARGLAHVINVLDPDRIVLGGGLSNVERLYQDIPALIQRYAFSDGVDTDIARLSTETRAEFAEPPGYGHRSRRVARA